MKRTLTAAIGLVFLGLLVHGAAFAQGANTGDRKLDSLLVQINTHAEADPAGFFLQLSRQHNIPEEEIRLAKERHGLTFGDIFMAVILALRTNRRVGDVAAEYGQNQGQGWGVMAMRMGIKPGSPEFKQLKANAGGFGRHMKTMAKARKRNKRS